MSRYCLHVITSHVSNVYMYNQIVGITQYPAVVYGGYTVKNLRFKRFIHRTKPSRDVREIMNRYPIQLIHAHFGALGAKYVGVANKYGKRLVTHFRGGDGSNDRAVRDKLRHKYEQLAKYGDLFLPVCKAMVPMLQDLGFPKNKIKVLYGGIDVRQFSFRKRDFATKDKYRICFVGKTSPKKGIPDLINAFARLNKEFDNLELRLISTTPKSRIDREELKKILTMILKHDLKGKVFFRFDVNNRELHRELHNAHLFCHPSITHKGNIEGIPNAIKEAMATGLPSVSTFHAGIPELITHKQNGLLVPERDPEKLSMALATLIEKPTMCETFARRGRQTVKDKFDLYKQLRVQKHYYDSLFK